MYALPSRDIVVTGLKLPPNIRILILFGLPIQSQYESNFESQSATDINSDDISPDTDSDSDDSASDNDSDSGAPLSMQINAANSGPQPSATDSNSDSDANDIANASDDSDSDSASEDTHAPTDENSDALAVSDYEPTAMVAGLETAVASGIPFVVAMDEEGQGLAGLGAVAISTLVVSSSSLSGGVLGAGVQSSMAAMDVDVDSGANGNANKDFSTSTAVQSQSITEGFIASVPTGGMNESFTGGALPGARGGRLGLEGGMSGGWLIWGVLFVVWFVL
ncbi:hypothetical protein SBOR_1363 [Sclerotinia borealis F-4128]|uniref:Uncharacterized protein n=1 Tax=Sclerotinia borealis (strain F-4128) TaxID=1432307 RepID=W9CN93_SCLBF|nr:hypothetical protein SBOR_1363 [Sclerotinia borealis F-4128]